MGKNVIYVVLVHLVKKSAKGSFNGQTLKTGLIMNCFMPVEVNQ